MAIIGITLDEVIRDFIGQVHYTYEKYYNKLEIKSEDIIDFDLKKHFKFNSDLEFNKFLFSEASLEIFGHSDQLEGNLVTYLNRFVMDIKDDEEHSVILINREMDKAIPATLFFLSKLSCKIEEIKFVNEYSKVWDNVDIIITATPNILDTKPEGKKTIKIKSSYNEKSKSDYEFDKLTDLINNEIEIEKIFN